jgi:hypothetical protein
MADVPKPGDRVQGYRGPPFVRGRTGTVKTVEEGRVVVDWDDDRPMPFEAMPLAWLMAPVQAAAAKESPEAAEESADYAAMTAAELREELRSRDLPTGGNKRGLIDRLVEHDNA